MNKVSKHSFKTTVFYILFGLWCIITTNSCTKDEGHHLTDVYIAYHDKEIFIGDTIYLQLRYYPDNATLGIPTQPIIWSVSNPDIAQIDDSGRLSCLDYGHVTVKARLGNYWAEKVLHINFNLKFDDKRLEEYLIAYLDENKNGTIDSQEIDDLIGLDLAPIGYTDDPISLKSIEMFSGRITTLKLQGLNIVDFDANRFKKLENLNCALTSLHSLDVSNLRKLNMLDCHGSPISSLTLGTDTENSPYLLEVINCQRCELTELDISGCKHLSYIDCSYNKLQSLDISNNYNLRAVACEGNEFDAESIIIH